MIARGRAVLLACAGYTAAAVAYTWPLAARLNGVPHDRFDPLLTTWFLWWSGTQAVPLTARWWNAPMFAPATGVFAFSEHLLGLTPIAVPFTLLSGNPLVGHNVAFIATYVLSAICAHFLAYTLTKRHDVSAVAAVAFAFAPYRLPQAPHIQVLASFWTPLCLGALHRYAQTRRTRWIVLAPFLYGYQSILRDTYGFTRTIGEMRAFSADVASLLSAGEDLLVWSWVRVFDRPEANLFPGLTIVVLCALALRAARPFAADVTERRRTVLVRRTLAVLLAVLLAASALPFAYGTWQLTIGGARLVSISRGDKPLSVAFAVALLLLAFLPGVRAAFRRRSAAAFYVLAAFVTWIFALGPDPTLMGQRLLYRAPYSWLMLMPGFDGLRVPARFWTMTLVCLAVTGALAVHRLQGSARRIAVALAIAGLLVDGWPARFAVLAAPPIRPSPDGAAFRLDLPISDAGDPQALYQQMFDPKPLYNGFSGFTAPHYPAMKALLEEGDERVLRILAARGPLAIVIDHAGDVDGTQRALVRAFPGVRAVRAEAEWSSYLIPQGDAPAETPDPTGTPVRVKSVTASAGKAPAGRAIDGNLDTAWSAAKDTPDIVFTIELEESGAVGQVVVELAQYAADFPARLRIDVSPDGAQWSTVSSGSGALPAYYAGIRHPKEVPAVFPIGRDGVRFIRLEQTGTSARDWSIAELRVLR